MPSLRLSFAKSLARLRRPKLAAGKNLELRSVPVREVGDPGKLSLKPDRADAAFEVASRLDAPSIKGVKPPPPPIVLELDAALAAPDTHSSGFDAWPDIEVHEDPVSEAVSARLLSLLLQPPYRAEEDEISAVPSDLYPYQAGALDALTEHSSFLLAAETGLSRTGIAVVALADLIQRREVRRALVIAPAVRHRHWQRTADDWAPGLVWSALGPGGRPVRREWHRPAHIVLCDPQRWVQDLSRGFVPRGEAPFDLIAVDSSLSVVHKSPQVMESVTRLRPGRRWALAGALPDQVEDWRTLFSFMTPDEPIGGQESLEGLRERLGDYYLSLRRADLGSELGIRVRREFWLDLDEQQAAAYREALAQERHTLRQLGESVARTHIESALGALNRATAFAQGRLDGVKIRALTDLLEAVGPNDNKVVLFSQYLHRTLEPLKQALHAYGAQVLSDTAANAEREQILATFRRDPRRRVLLAHLEARADGQRLPASHIVHFDVSWNSARRIRAEQRFFPDLKPDLPLTITEFWVAGTHDERLHDLLGSRGLLPSDLPQGTQLSELEGRITVQDWLSSVFQATEEVRRERAEPTGTGLLPGTTTLRAELENFSDEEMAEAVGVLTHALGFPNSARTSDPDFDGLSLKASPGIGTQGDVLVRVLRSEKNVGVAEGRALLEVVDEEEGYVGGCLVATTDFTTACKDLAEESEGRLSLVSGTEFYRHLRILGWL